MDRIPVSTKYLLSVLDFKPSANSDETVFRKGTISVRSITRAIQFPMSETYSWIYSDDVENKRGEFHFVDELEKLLSESKEILVLKEKLELLREESESIRKRIKGLSLTSEERKGNMSPEVKKLCEAEGLTFPIIL